MSAAAVETLKRPLVGGDARATCTAHCDSDSDCANATLSQCAGGFVCAAVGTACQKLCVCGVDAKPAPKCP